MDNMEITLACSPEVNTCMSDRIKVAKYHAIYISTSENLLKQNSLCLTISRLIANLITILFLSLFYFIQDEW